ncbi:IS1 family transposase [Aeromonas sobria]|uniref:IS1 family transposase n=1 Tax=Aeromonas sobria TaxID=646 RepID=UPI0026489F2B|nr:IS1 family transposase [Aeromonas sobria]
MMWRLSVNSMNNEPMSATKTIDTNHFISLIIKKNMLLSIPLDPRNDKRCRRLLSLLSPLQIGFITSDDWGSYAKEVPHEIHLTGKIFTQRIERNNLTLRTRIKRLARKTICFSRSVELHEKVIGAFIKRHHFN